MCLFFSACAKGGADKRGIRIYYLNKADYGIKEQEYVPEANDRDRIIEELIARPTYPAPRVWLDPEIKDFYAFTTDHLHVEDYKCGPQVKDIPIAV